MEELLNEEMIEKLYWVFDDLRKRKAERDAFKMVMREFAHAELKRYLLEDLHYTGVSNGD